MTLYLDIIKSKMVMIPINHTDPLLLSSDNVGPCMTLELSAIKLTMVMIPIHHAAPLLLSPDNVGALHDIKSWRNKAYNGHDTH